MNWSKVPHELSKSKLNPSVKVVYLYMSTFDPCFPSQRGIAQALGMDLRTVRRAIDELVKRGFITIIKKGTHKKGSTVYKINETGDTTTSRAVIRPSVESVTEGPGTYTTRTIKSNSNTIGGVIRPSVLEATPMVGPVVLPITEDMDTSTTGKNNTTGGLRTSLLTIKEKVEFILNQEQINYARWVGQVAIAEMNKGHSVSSWLSQQIDEQYETVRNA